MRIVLSASPIIVTILVIGCFDKSEPVTATPSQQAELQEMTEPSKPDLFAFLAGELKEIVAENPANTSNLTPITEWSMERDENGFTITTTTAAHEPIKTFLQVAFGPPKFDHSGTLIFRNDEKPTTVMLNHEPDHTQIIVLQWSNPKVQARIEEAQAEAATKATLDAVAEVQKLIDAASNEADEAKSAALFEEVHRKLNELLSAWNIIEPDSEFAEVKKLWDAASTEEDEVKRLELLEEAQRKLDEMTSAMDVDQSDGQSDLDQSIPQ